MIILSVRFSLKYVRDVPILSVFVGAQYFMT